MSKSTQRNKGRAEGMTTITFPLREDLKESLKDRATKTRAELAVADLCRLALEYQEERNWKDLPEAAKVRP